MAVGKSDGLVDSEYSSLYLTGGDLMGLPNNPAYDSKLIPESLTRPTESFWPFKELAPVPSSLNSQHYNISLRSNTPPLSMPDKNTPPGMGNKEPPNALRLAKRKTP